MVFCCFACGTHYNPLNTRTFHRFPKNEDLKLKWLEAIGKTKVYNGAVICSDHFDEEDFSENIFATRKRLRPNVVPHLNHERIIVIVEDDFDNSTEENNTSNNVGTTNSSLPGKYTSDIITEADVSHSIQPTLDACDTTADEGEHHYKTYRRPRCEENETTLAIEREPKFGAEVQEGENTQQLELSNSDEFTPAEENQHGNTNNRKVFVKLPNNGTDYFTRKDFTSEHAWNKFLKTMAYARHNRKILQQQSLRHKNRVADMKKLLLIYMRKDQQKNI